MAQRVKAFATNNLSSIHRSHSVRRKLLPKVVPWALHVHYEMCMPCTDMRDTNTAMRNKKSKINDQH